jgi:hypothetical protein
LRCQSRRGPLQALPSFQIHSLPGFGSLVSIYLHVVSVTKNHFAALVVNNWLYIDGGEIWAVYGSDTTPSSVYSASSPWQLSGHEIIISNRFANPSHRPYVVVDSELSNGSS